MTTRIVKEPPYRVEVANIVNSSELAQVYLDSLPLYRVGLKPGERGLEIGLAHGYFLLGPFLKVGPLRNSPHALVIGYLCTIGLIIIMFSGLSLYLTVRYENDTENYEKMKNFANGIFMGLFGGSLFTFLLLINPL